MKIFEKFIIIFVQKAKNILLLYKGIDSNKHFS